jgi:hypothetical protein
MGVCTGKNLGLQLMKRISILTVINEATTLAKQYRFYFHEKQTHFIRSSGWKSSKSVAPEK